MATMSGVKGVDFTLPVSPPLVLPPLTLLDLARELIDNQGLVEEARQAADAAAQAQAATRAIAERFENATGSDNGLDAAESAALQMEMEAAIDRSVQMDSWASAARKRIEDLTHWEHGFQYLPELSQANALSVYSEGTAVPNTVGADPNTLNTKPTGNTESFPAPSFLWCDPFVVVARDERSLFGVPETSFLARRDRARRALVAHESFDAENEFWTGSQVPTNFHLTWSPSSPTTSPHRTVAGVVNPTPAPGTILGTAVGLKQSLESLDQSIARAEGGTGMIHATPFVVQAWMSQFPYIRDSDGKVYTVNHNLICAGYGYPGVGPDQAARSSAADGHTTINTPGITSATAAFTSFDIGRAITGAGIPAGAVILSVQSATAATLSVNATSTQTTSTFTIPGQGGDASGSPQQWAYATEMVYYCRGDMHAYPRDFDELSPQGPTFDNAPVRVERAWALITNQILRAAVLVDTTQP